LWQATTARKVGAGINAQAALTGVTATARTQIDIDQFTAAGSYSLSAVSKQPTEQAGHGAPSTSEQACPPPMT